LMTQSSVFSLVVGWALNPRGFPKCFFGAGQGAQANNELGSFLCPGIPDGRVGACAPITAIYFTHALLFCRPGPEYGSEKLKLQHNKTRDRKGSNEVSFAFSHLYLEYTQSSEIKFGACRCRFEGCSIRSS
jgi:hypothetical protein